MPIRDKWYNSQVFHTKNRQLYLCVGIISCVFEILGCNFWAFHIENEQSYLYVGIISCLLKICEGNFWAFYTENRQAYLHAGIISCPFEIFGKLTNTPESHYIRLTKKMI